MSARGADDANMGDDVAQRDVSHAESITVDDFRETRKEQPVGSNVQRNLKITSRQGTQVSGRGVRPVCKGEVEPRDTRHKAARNLRMVQRSHACRGIIASLGPGIESTRKSIFPAKVVGFPSCEKLVEICLWYLDNLGCQSGVSVRQ